MIYVALSEKDQAQDRLEEAAREHDGLYRTLANVDPYFDSLRGDPRFEALVSAIFVPGTLYLKTRELKSACNAGHVYYNVGIANGVVTWLLMQKFAILLIKGVFVRWVC